MINRTPHLIPYQGSKRKLAPQILETIQYDSVNTLFEPFAGSAAVTLASASVGIAKQYVISDKYEPLMSLWKLIISNPSLVYSKYNELWTSQLDDPKGYFLQVRSEFNQDHDPVKLLYLIARCVKNSIRFNTNGEFNQSSDNRRLGMKPEKVRFESMAISALLKDRVSIVADDFMDIISRATSDDLVYMDPPWQGTSLNKDPRYAYILDFDSLIQGIELLNNKDVPFILSFDGTCGDKKYGKELPKYLNLVKVDLDAGRSSQATLLGRNQRTIEALYLSASLLEKNQLYTPKKSSNIETYQQMPLFN